MVNTNRKNNFIQSTTLKEYFTENGEVISFEKGEFLFSEDQAADKLYMIQSGNLKIGKITDDGKEISLRMCKKDDIIGELTLYCGNTHHFSHAEGIVSGTVIMIEKFSLEKELLKNHTLTIEYMKMLNTSINKDRTLFRDLMLYGKKGAIYSTLIRFSNSYGNKQDNGTLINLSLTNQELADFCGTTRESVNRVLNELRRDHIISIESGYITIHDFNYLRAEINCEYCPLSACIIN